MKFLLILFYFIISSFSPVNAGHKVYFCDEEVPITDDFVANKLMNIIKKQIPTSKLAGLRYKTQKWFPWLEGELQRAGLPLDLKYLPIVESQFKNVAHSSVGAAGLWQIMPKTGQGLNLVVNPPYRDDRLDPALSTPAACRLLREYYSLIRRWNRGQGSWALTCAAYNWGPGNVQKAMNSQGGNYYTMNIVEETSNYVYKIIAIKELWEHPERYMNSFDRNVFEKELMLEAKRENANQKNKKIYKVKSGDDQIDIELLDDRLDNDDKQSYDDEIYELGEESFEVSNFSNNESKDNQDKREANFTEIIASLVTSEKDFHDGNMVSIQLKENLILPNGTFKRKEQIMKGIGWVIDNKVMVDLSDGIEVQFENEKGIPFNLIRNKNIILILKVPKD